MKKTLLLIASAFTINAFAQLPTYFPTNGLVAAYTFDGNANDMSGNSNNGTVTGATLTTDRNGNANSAYSFDGKSNYIDIPIQQNNITSYSISCWFNFPSTAPSGSYRGIVQASGAYPNAKYSLSIQMSADPTFAAQNRISTAINGPGVFNGWITQKTYNDNQWHHVVGVLNSTTGNKITSSNILMYIDGILVSSTSTAVDYSSVSSPLNGFGNTRIGTTEHITPSRYFLGSIDEVAIYNRALTQTEITQLYTGVKATPDPKCQPAITNGLVAYYPFCGNADDVSGNSNNGTVNGATLTTDRNGNANSAYSFDGKNQWIDVADNTNLNPTTQLSISLWVESSATQSNAGIVGKWNNFNGSIGSGQEQYVLHANGQGVRLITKTTIQNEVVEPSILYNNGNWHHFVGVWTGSIMKLYRDNILVASIAQTGSIPSFNQKLEIGRYAGGQGTYFNGKIDDIAIYNRVLSASEITQLYTGCTLTAAITPQSATTFCQGDSVSLKANTGTNYTYKWYNNGNIINNATGSSYSASQSGSYTVKTDSSGCSGTSSAVAVTVNALPVVSINSIPNSIYANSSALVLSGNPTGGTFSGNGVSGSSFTPKNAGLGTKQISYKYTDGNTCSGYASASTIVIDTTGIVCSKYDTVTKYISVTDTLVINAKLTGVASPNNSNMLKVFPNPTNDKLFINTGNYAVMNNYTIKITNALSQVVFTSKVTQQEFVIDLNTFGNKGTYFFELYDGNNTKIEVRKIILQ